MLIRQREWRIARPYRMLYAVGLLHWLLLIQWVRLPHWSACFGWLALASYLAVYVPLFVGISRILVHRWAVSSVIAAPIVWTGLELALRPSVHGLLHRIVGTYPIAAAAIGPGGRCVGRSYGVSFLVMLVAACLARLMPLSGVRRVAWPAILAVASVLACWLYGTVQLRSDATPEGGTHRLRVALIQGSFDTEFDGNVYHAQDRADRLFLTMCDSRSRQRDNRRTWT